jgi:hypothetical protein
MFIIMILLSQAEFSGSPVVCQFSSLGSLTSKWLKEFNESLCAGLNPDGTPLALGPSQVFIMIIINMLMPR